MTLIRRRLKTVFVLMLIFTLCVTTLFSGIGYAGYAAAQDVADEGEILSPKTGDEMSLALWLTLGLLAGGGLFAFLLRGARKGSSK